MSEIIKTDLLGVGRTACGFQDRFVISCCVSRRFPIQIGCVIVAQVAAVHRCHTATAQITEYIATIDRKHASSLGTK